MNNFIKYNFLLNRFLGDCLPIVPLFGVLLLEYGLSLSEISLTLFVLAASVMIFEIPTGMITDKMPAKFGVVIARIFKLSAFSIIAFFPSLTGVLIGVCIWGLASAFDSGAFQSYLYQNVRKSGSTEDFNKLYAQTSTAAMVGLLVSAAIATQVSIVGLFGLQIIGLVFLSLSVLSVLLYPNVKRVFIDTEIVNDSHLPKNSFTVIRYILHTKTLLLLLIIGVLAGSVKGSLDEYVSIMLLEKGLGIIWIGYVLFSFELVKSFGGFISQWIPTSLRIQKISLVCMGVGFIIVGISNVWIALGVFALILVFDSILWIQNDIGIQHNSNDTNRATTSSIKNFLTEVISATIFLFAWIYGGSLFISSYFVIGGLLLLFAGTVLLVFRIKNSS